MNGVRAVFLRELRAGFVPDAVILLLALATFTVVERTLIAGGKLSEDTRQTVNGVLFGCAALLSFASGARTFPREIKERRLLSLCTLPISRGALWCALIGGRLAAITAAVASLLLARPSILRTLTQPGFLILFLAFIPVLFMAGVCSSLTFEKNAQVYLIGYPVEIFSIVQALGLASAGSPSLGLTAWSWALALVSLLLVFLALSWHFFQMGDFTVQWRSLAKQALLAVSLSCTFGLIGAVTHSRLLADCLGSWEEEWVYRSVSPGGLYLAVSERQADRPGLSWLRIVETASGRVLATRMWHDLQWASWSRHEQELHLLVLDHWAPEPWRDFFRPQPTWVRLSPEGKELSRFQLGFIHDSAFLLDGTDLIIHQTKDVIQLLQLQNQSTPLVIEELPADSELMDLQFHFHSRVNFDALRSMWLVKDSSVQVAFDALGSSWRVENRRVRKINSTEARSSSLSKFVLRWREDDMTTLSLWTRSSETSPWELRATGLTAKPKAPKPEDVRREVHPSLVRDDQRPSIYDAVGLAVYLPTGGRDGLASLYDGVQDWEIPLPACKGGRAAFPELIAPQSGRAWFLVRFQCHTPASTGETIRVRHFYYLPGSGAVKPLPVLDRVMGRNPFPAARLAYLDETSAIWRSEDGDWIVLRDGKLQTLWPPKN